MADKEKLQNSPSVDESSQNDEITIDIAQIIRAFFKFWWICVLAAIVLGSSVLVKELITFVPSYTASTTFTVSLEQTQDIKGASTYIFYYQQSTVGQMADTFPYLLKTQLMQSAIKRNLGSENIEANLSMTYVTDTNMFTLTSTCSDPQKAYDTLIAAIDAYPEISKFVIGNIQIHEITQPQLPTSPSNSHNFVRSTFIGAAIGAILGLVWICIYAIFRKTLRTQDDVKESLRCDVLGFIPIVTFKKYKQEIDGRVIITNPLVPSTYNEEIKVVRNTIENRMKGKKVLMVTSTAPGEGKTTVAVNIAQSFYQAGKRVLLIDADLRNQSVSDMLEIKRENKNGCFIQKAENAPDVMLFNVNGADIWKYIQVEKMNELIGKAREIYDYIIIDTPPCGLISDATTIAQASDAAIYVVLQDTVRATRIKSSMEALMATDVDILGCVLNGTNTGIGSAYGYGYGRYGHYGYGYGKYGYGRYGHYGYGRYGKYGYGKYGKNYGKYGYGRYGKYGYGYGKYGYGYGKYGSYGYGKYGSYGYGEYGEEKSSKDKSKSKKAKD